MNRIEHGGADDIRNRGRDSRSRLCAVFKPKAAWGRCRQSASRATGATNRSGLGYAHLGTADEQRTVGGVGVVIADVAMVKNLSQSGAKFD